MRLGSCIALELCVAAGAVAGMWVGVGKAVDLAGSYSGEAEAATGPAPRIVRLPAAELHVAVPAQTTVFDEPDDVLLSPIGGALAHVRLNHGGTSLSLRLDFANGSHAAFKPQQTNGQSDPRKEIAAYRIDRLLGIGHVPPAKPGAFPVDELIAATDADARTFTAGRIHDEGIAHDGVLHGEVSWWIPEIRDQRIGPWRVDEDAGIELWTRYLHPNVAIPDDRRALIAQLVTLVVFDVLIDNADRWSGYNTKGSPDHRTLYFMDNTLSFSQFTFGHRNNLDPLFKIEIFPRRLVERLRGLTPQGIAAAIDVGDDPLGPLLTEPEITALLARRDHLLAYIDGLIAEYGEANVLVLP